MTKERVSRVRSSYSQTEEITDKLERILEILKRMNVVSQMKFVANNGMFISHDRVSVKNKVVVTDLLFVHNAIFDSITMDGETFENEGNDFYTKTDEEGRSIQISTNEEKGVIYGDIEIFVDEGEHNTIQRIEFEIKNGRMDITLVKTYNSSILRNLI